jgi:hypothetical protein
MGEIRRAIAREEQDRRKEDRFASTLLYIEYPLSHEGAARLGGQRKGAGNDQRKDANAATKTHHLGFSWLEEWTSRVRLAGRS